MCQRYKVYLALWVNQQILNEAGIPQIRNIQDWIEFCRRASATPGRYGYSGTGEDNALITYRIATEVFTNLNIGDGSTLAIYLFIIMAIFSFFSIRLLRKVDF